MRLTLAPTLITLAAALWGCDRRDDLDGSRAAIPGLRDAGARYQLPGSERAAVYDLYDNRLVASTYRKGSLVIDLAGPDRAKYLLGGARTEWRPVKGERRAMAPEGRVGVVMVPLDGDASGVRRGEGGSIELRLYARPAVKNQLVSVFVNDVRVGDLSMPAISWREYSIEVPAERWQRGANEVRFYFRSVGELGGVETGAAIARLAVGGSARASDAAPLETGTVTRGGARLEALRVPEDTRLSFPVWVPREKPQLVLAVAGAGKEASIRVATDRGAAEVLWSGRPGKKWTPIEIDLAALAGTFARLDFASEGAIAWGRPKLVAQGPAARGESERPAADHVIVWSVSSLRPDRIAKSAPVMTGFLGSGARFSRLTAAAPLPGLAHAALMTGRAPEGSSIPEEAVTLGERFRRAGYVTALVSGNGFVHDEGGFAQGFDVYENPMRNRLPHDASILWKEARKVLARHRDDRTFLYLATVEPHLPYQPDESSLALEWSGAPPMAIEPATTAELSESVRAGRRKLSDNQQRYVTALYEACLRDADAAFAAMLADLDELGVADRTAVVLVGDHGEELWERGAFGHGGHVYREVLATPLAVRAPGLAPAVIDGVDVEGVDVYATVLDLAGIAPNAEVQGESLLPLARGWRPPLPRPARARLPGVARSLRVGRYELIVPLRGPVELYDLAADPGQTKNVAGERLVALSHLLATFGTAVSYEARWSRRRWGAVNNVTPAFAADHGD